MNDLSHSARAQAFLDFWLKLDEERVAKGEDLIGFEQAWVEYRAHLIEQEAQRRFMEHAAYGERDAHR